MEINTTLTAVVGDLAKALEVLALFGVAGLFGKKKPEEESLDTGDAIERLDNGLDYLSDADRRREGHYPAALSGETTLEDAQTAYDISEALKAVEDKSGKRKWW